MNLKKILKRTFQGIFVNDVKNVSILTSKKRDSQLETKLFS